jgi:exonuclease III
MAQLGILNARSVVNITEHNLDVLGITETWLSTHSKVELKAVCPPGYTITHKPRSGRRGGGVAIIHRDTIHTTVKPTFEAKSFESIEATLTVSSITVRLVIMYRPPPSQKNNVTKGHFFEEFSTYLESLSLASGKIIISGDFNFPMETDNHPDTKTMNELLESSGLVQHVREATHMNGHMLDLVISRPEDKIIASTIVSSLFSDHHAILIKLCLNKPPLPTKSTVCRNFKKMDMDAFRKDLGQLQIVSDLPDHFDDLISLYNSDIQ